MEESVAKAAATIAAGSATTTTKRTLIRLKRRRGAPLPETIRISPNTSANDKQNNSNNHVTKRFRTGDNATTNQLANLLHMTSLTESNSEDHHKRKTMEVGGDESFSSLSSFPKTTMSRPIVFKRLKTTNTSMLWKEYSSSPSSKKRKNEILRVVDCLHDDNDDDDENNDKKNDTQPQHSQSTSTQSSSHPSKKRPRISILTTQDVQYDLFWTNPNQRKYDAPQPLPSTFTNQKQKQKQSTHKKNSTLIMSPIIHLVDSQLKDYHQYGPGPLQETGTGTGSYMHFLQSVILPSVSTSNLKIKINHQNPLTYFLNHACSNGMGTILHGCALWNDVEGASQFVFHGNINVHIVDGDGQTALHVAQMCGHDSIVQIIQRRMQQEIVEDTDKNVNVPLKEQDQDNDNDDDDDDDYVYDVYCIDHDIREEQTKGEEKNIEQDQNSRQVSDENDSLPNNNNSDKDDDDVFVELENGIGYWDHHGELIIETINEVVEHEDTNVEEDYDSNDEAYEGNDYPEDEEEDGYYDDDDDDDEIGYWDRAQEVQWDDEEYYGM